jgi:hypothetical protein
MKVEQKHFGTVPRKSFYDFHDSIYVPQVLASLSTTVTRIRSGAASSHSNVFSYGLANLLARLMLAERFHNASQPLKASDMTQKHLRNG